MPWKDGYTISDERSLTDAEVRWPDGNRCCFSITVDLSVASGPEGITEADLANPKTQFGLREGLDRTKDALDRFGGHWPRLGRVRRKHAVSAARQSNLATKPKSGLPVLLHRAYPIGLLPALRL